MITENDLIEAIAECKSSKNPNANICVKLAAFYTIKDHLYPSKQPTKNEIPSYSYTASQSNFLRLVAEKDIGNIFPILDELMNTLMLINPKLYDCVMRKIENA